jgi:hypothetical protein
MKFLDEYRDADLALEYARESRASRASTGH